MILDAVGKMTSYAKSIPGIGEALAFAAGAASLAAGRYELPGGDYALVQEYETLAPSSLAWEAHRVHADVQLMLEGSETMGWAAALEGEGPYDEAKDVILAPRAADAASFDLKPGLFVLFLPGEAHRPRGNSGVAMKVRKLVVKLRMA
jgi:YhcH/YjgK/YiaL family protein